MVKRDSLLLAVVMTAVCTFPVFAQDKAADEQQQPAAAPAPVETPAAAPVVAPASGQDLQWIWGEVVTVDGQAKSMSVKYLDYDSDTEKTIDIAADPDTKFEEVKGMGDIKPQDTVSIEYLAKDGKNVAKGITVERIEQTDVGEGTESPAAAPEKVGTGPIAPPEQNNEAPADTESSK